MIRVKIKYLDQNISQIEIKGHSENEDGYNDLVCAGVSCIVYGTLNALEELTLNNYLVKQDDGYTLMEISESNEVNQIILKTMVIQLATIVEKYPMYIKIKQEVKS